MSVFLMSYLLVSGWEFQATDCAQTFRRNVIAQTLWGNPVFSGFRNEKKKICQHTLEVKVILRRLCGEDYTAGDSIDSKPGREML